MLEFKLGKGGLYWGVLESDDNRLEDCSVLLDTGSSFTYVTACGLIRDTHLVSVLASKLQCKNEYTVAKDVDGKVLRAYPFILRNINLCNVRLSGMRLYLNFDSAESIMLLGCDFLKYCSITKSIRGRSISITGMDMQSYYGDIQSDNLVVGTLNKLLAVNECIAVRNDEYVVKTASAGIVKYSKKRIKYLLSRGEQIEGLRLSSDGRLLVARNIQRV